MRNKILVMLGVCLAASALEASADEGHPFRAMVFPEANYMALKDAYWEPFVKQEGIKDGDLHDYDGHVTDLAVMVKNKNTSWDVVQMESRTLDVACREGLLEKLDKARIGNMHDFLPSAVSDCGMGIFTWSQALTYDPRKVKGSPVSWADFWDLKKFPGKRGLRHSAKYTLEIALLADGVAPTDIYKVLSTKEGVDRAFRKLDEIRDNIVWWEAAPQPVLFMAAGKVVMSSSYTLWVDSEQQNKKPYRLVWKQNLYDIDSWAIPKGTSNLDEAYKFIAFASRPENQKNFSTKIAYGPTNLKAVPLLDPRLRTRLPAGNNMKDAVAIDTAFWVKNESALQKRFLDWAPVLVKQVTDDDELPPGPPDASAGHHH